MALANGSHPPKGVRSARLAPGQLVERQQRVDPVDDGLVEADSNVFLGRAQRTRFVRLRHARAWYGRRVTSTQLTR
jgi:hypothetical protein